MVRTAQRSVRRSGLTAAVPSRSGYGSGVDDENFSARCLIQTRCGWGQPRAASIVALSLSYTAGWKAVVEGFHS